MSDDLVNRLRSGVRPYDTITLAGVKHDPRCLEAADRIEALEAEIERLSKWAALGEWVMAAWPEIGDLDGFDLQKLAIKCGVLVEIPGGYDPDYHIDSVGAAPERGDPWFEIISFPRAALEEKNDDE